MRVEALALKLRPRPMAEAADLGVRLVMTNARSVWLSFTPIFAVVAVLALTTAGIANWLPGLVIFWMKPWLDRTLLFIHSRAVFGETTRLADVWQARGTVLWSRLPVTLTLARLSPWRSYIQAIDHLEGQRGKAGRRRRVQLLRGKRGAAMAMQAVFANLEFTLSLGLFGIALLFAPEGTRLDLFKWMGEDDVSTHVVLSGLYACVVLFVEPFFVGAGFAMYLNRRVELEGWDIEQEFRRAFSQ